MTKIEMIFIPTGFTYKLQPLDVGVFGNLKSKFMAGWNDSNYNYPEHTKNFHSNQIEVLLKTIRSIKKDDIKSSFLKALNC